MELPCDFTIRARFLSLARSKLRLCSANHRPGYWSNLPCDWQSTAWARDRKWTQVCMITWKHIPHYWPFVRGIHHDDMDTLSAGLLWFPSQRATSAFPTQRASNVELWNCLSDKSLWLIDKITIITDEAVMRPSDLYNGNSYTDKTFILN